MNMIVGFAEEIRSAGVHVQLTENGLRLEPPGIEYSLVDLYRPSGDDVRAARGPKTFLIIRRASRYALREAREGNYLSDTGGFRVVAPGVALQRDGVATPARRTGVRLRGLSGVVAETLLLGGDRSWSVHELADGAGLSAALAHRILTRLEAESLVKAQGVGPSKKRRVTDRRALAECWSEEAEAPQLIVRGYMYLETPQLDLVPLLERLGTAAVGGALAANLYEPVLMHSRPPYKVWVPYRTRLARIEEAGVQVVAEGANVEFVTSRADPWLRHSSREGLPRISRWRAWMEIATAEGRLQELAEALLNRLLEEA